MANIERIQGVLLRLAAYREEAGRLSYRERQDQITLLSERWKYTDAEVAAAKAAMTSHDREYVEGCDAPPATFLPERD